MAERPPPRSLYSGMPAALAAMSHSAVSHAPMLRRPILRWRMRMAACRSSRASGSWPISTGLRKRISAPASVSAGLVAEPRNALPSMPASVLMVSRPRLLLPDWFCEPEVYFVGGMSSQAKRVSSTASIFMACSSPAAARGRSAICFSDRRRSSRVPPALRASRAGLHTRWCWPVSRHRNTPPARPPCHPCRACPSGTWSP
jgi:hypothetical protein